MTRVAFNCGRLEYDKPSIGGLLQHKGCRWEQFRVINGLRLRAHIDEAVLEAQVMRWRTVSQHPSLSWDMHVCDASLRENCTCSIFSCIRGSERDDPQYDNSHSEIFSRLTTDFLLREKNIWYDIIDAKVSYFL